MISQAGFGSDLNYTKVKHLISQQRSAKKLGLLMVLLTSLVVLSGCEYEYTGPGFEIVEENPNAEPWFNVYRPVDMLQAVEETGHLLPVVVWANGGCLRSDFTWQPLFKRWAAQGYVVLALAESPNGGAVAATTVADQSALIDWAVNDSGYVDMLDTSKVIAAGNSCGGVTSLGLASEDPRVAGVFVLSGSSALASSSKKVMAGITVPVGYVIGGPTDVSSGPAANDYNLLSDSVPAMITRRAVGGHITVSTTVPILEEIADISFHWMDLVLYGNESSYAELMSENVCSDCTAGDWSMESRALEMLLQ